MRLSLVHEQKTFLAKRKQGNTTDGPVPFLPMTKPEDTMARKGTGAEDEEHEKRKGAVLVSRVNA